MWYFFSSMNRKHRLTKNNEVCLPENSIFLSNLTASNPGQTPIPAKLTQFPIRPNFFFVNLYFEFMTKLYRLVFASFVALTLHFTASSQSVGINGTGAPAVASSILDVSSNTKGVLVPRMTKTEKNAIASPANALLVYQTGPDSIGFHYYDLPNTQWVFINASGYATDTTAWKITGNSNITSSHFLGTLNDSALRFRIRNTPSGIIDSAARLTFFGFRSGIANTTGEWNTSMGAYSLGTNTTGRDNVAIGTNTSYGNDTSSRNTAMGRDALYYNKHDNNTAIGFSAGAYSDLDPVNFPNQRVTYLGSLAGYGYWVGPKSVGIGNRALYNYESATNTLWGSSTGRSTAVGDSALGLTWGSSNVAIGTEALSRGRGSYQNVAIGDSALGGAVSTIFNVAVGYKALNKQVNQGANTAVGYFSQRDSSVNTYYNTSIGAYSMEYNRTGIYNTGLGLSTMRLADSTSFNTAVGADAMYNHKKGNYNTAVGFEAMGIDSAGWYNVAMGWRSLRNNKTGQQNTAIGVGALESDSIGSYNTGIGRYGGFGAKRGNYNIWMGYASGYAADSADLSTAVGTNSGYYNKRDFLVAYGAYSLTYNSQTATSDLEGMENTGLGYGTSYLNRTGSKNTSVGYQAMNGNGIFGSYNRNVAVGDSAMFSISSGNSNVGIGFKAGNAIRNGSNNIMIGDSALNLNVSGSQHIAIGTRALNNTTANYPNTAVGYLSMDSMSNTGANTALGSYTMSFLRTGINNTAIGNAAMYQAETGDNNTAVGNDAARLDSGSNNTAIGASALRYNKRSDNTALGFRAAYVNNYPIGGVHYTFGTENTAIGYRSLQANVSGRKNTAIGHRALAMYVDGGLLFINPSSPASLISRNTAVGDSAQSYSFGQGNSSVGNATLGIIHNGDFNTAMGDSSMANATQADANDAYGYNSLKSLQNTYEAGYYNTAIGGQSMEFDTSAYATVAVGFRSLRNANKVSESVAIGVGAMENGDNTTWNVAVGRGALFNFGTAEQNTAIGAWALSKEVNGFWNSALGLFALENDTTGGGNTGIGVSAFRENQGSYDNTGLGINAGYFQKGPISQIGRNTFIGAYSGQGKNGTSDGYDNSGLGFASLYNNAKGYRNTAIGTRSMYSNDSSDYLTAVGYEALYSNYGQSAQTVAVGAYSLRLDTSAGLNTAVGYSAAYNNRSGSANTAMGSLALYYNNNGSFNTAIGQAALLGGGIYDASGNTAVGSNAIEDISTGNNNTAMGVSTLANNTTGSNNTAIGRQALQIITTGSNNTALGYLATGSANNLANATAIGANAYVAQSNSMVLGSINGVNGGSSYTNVGMGTTTPDARLHVLRNGVSGGTYHGSSSMIIEDNTNSYLQFTNPNANETGFLSGNASTIIRSAIIFRADSSLRLRTGGNIDRVTITNTGNTGIGVTTPDSLLSVADNFLVGSSGTVQYDNSVPVMNYMFKSGSTNADRMVVSHSPAFPNYGLQYQDNGDQFNFLGNGINRMAIELVTGDVGIAIANPIHTLQLGVDDAAKPATALWTIVSDERLKTVNGAYTKGLNDILKLNTIRYNYKSNTEQKLPSDEQFYGFTAQDVQKVFPEAVKAGKDGYLTLNLHPIMVAYVNAFKEQQQLIDNQQKQINDLLKRMEKLENK